MLHLSPWASRESSQLEQQSAGTTLRVCHLTRCQLLQHVAEVNIFIVIERV
jgi:hypothetical protein